MTDTTRPSFEPVLLNLANDGDYYIVTEALREFASEADHQADNAEENARYNSQPASARVAPLRAQAERARAIVTDVERQLDANSTARRPRG
ncbi:hypothetical protein [Rathayibacter sp. SD072]|uniref:hypothetical protein n=1 Tax=Rathayibacter sp. SD072 TaxID=2781731 RepID=UPI001A9661F7|nr:hypothetical protein [Rathayibacter sp. SD072]MBO0985007.1 hypothetical protein [Rathayibacter sp. SD072]